MQSFQYVCLIIIFCQLHCCRLQQVILSIDVEYIFPGRHHLTPTGTRCFPLTGLALHWSWSICLTFCAIQPNRVNRTARALQRGKVPGRFFFHVKISNKSAYDQSYNEQEKAFKPKTSQIFPASPISPVSSLEPRRWTFPSISEWTCMSQRLHSHVLRRYHWEFLELDDMIRI